MFYYVFVRSHLLVCACYYDNRIIRGVIRADNITNELVDASEHV